MKNKAGYVVVLLGMLMLTGCPQEAKEEGLPSTKGELTLTGAEFANDKYAFVVCEVPSGTEGTTTFKLLGIKDTASGGKKLVGVQVKGGTAKIPLYIHTGSTLKGYSGDEAEGICTIYVSSAKELENLTSKDIPTYLRYESVKFEKGKVTKKRSEAAVDNLEDIAGVSPAPSGDENKD